MEETKSDINLDGCHKEKGGGGGGKRRAVSIAHSNLGRAGFWRRCLPLAVERGADLWRRKKERRILFCREKKPRLLGGRTTYCKFSFYSFVKWEISFFNGSPKEGKGGK